MFPSMFPSQKADERPLRPDRKRFVVRWREAGGQRSKRFRLEEDAMAFDEVSRGPARQQASAPEPSPGTSGAGVYAYSTNAGVRYRFVFRQTDGTLSSRSGFRRRQAAAAARRKVIESVDRREITVCREDFADFWERFVVGASSFYGHQLLRVTRRRDREPMSLLDPCVLLGNRVRGALAGPS